MANMGIIGWVVIGILAGWIAEKVMKRSHGLVTNLIVGVLGALLGGFIAGQLGYGTDSLVISLLIAAGGAILLLAVLSLFKKR